MKKVLGLLICLGWSFTGSTAEWRPDSRLLKAVRQVESGGGVNVYGDDGRSLGDFQLRRGAWSDVNNWRKTRSLKVYDYDGYVYHQFINRVYAANYLTILHDQLTRQLRREPSIAELYAAYNMGMGTFGEKCNYDLRRVNAMTARKCEQIQRMIEPQMASVTSQRAGQLN